MDLQKTQNSCGALNTGPPPDLQNQESAGTLNSGPPPDLPNP